MQEGRRNNSKKRQAVYEALCARTDHPTAEMLYASLKPHIPDLSLGTVYRSLGTFVEDGLAISVGNVAGRERYDGNVAPHPHFVCRRCACVKDLQLPPQLPELLSAGGLDGCRVEGYALSLFGTCAECSAEAEQ